jgi:hypothetical protein
MLILTDAIKISIERVIQSILNIFIFQHVFSFTKLYLNGFIAFCVTLYLVAKLKAYAYKYVYVKLRNKAAKALKQEKFCIEEEEMLFIDSELQILDLNLGSSSLEQIIFNTINSMIEKNFHKDLFNFIFSSASQSSLLNLVVIILIEYLANKFEINFFLSMLYCLSFAFVLCFVSSLNYASILSDEWLNENNKQQPQFSDEKQAEEEENDFMKNMSFLTRDGRVLKKEIIMYKGEIISLLELKFDLSKQEICIEFRFIAAKYANRVGNLVKHVIANDVHKDESETSSGLIDSSSFKNSFSFVVPDYYNINNEFTKALKRSGFSQTEKWTEFRLIPLIDFKKSLFTNNPNKNSTKTLTKKEN